MITISKSELLGHASYGQGQVFVFLAILTDLAGNKKEGLASSSQLTVDTVVPVDFTLGGVVVSGGIVEAGYWNGSNSGLTVSVPIADDVSLVDGTVQVQARAGAGSYGALGSV